MDLEWCEGGSLYMAWRVLHHLPVYVKPGDVYAPFPYPPGHTLALALAGYLAGGLDYGPARAVSILSFALVCAALFVVVRREFSDAVRGAVAGLATVGLLTCAFPTTGGWYDLVRVDSMMLAFAVLAAALVSTPSPGWWRTIAAAMAITISVYTKQTAAFFAVWICLFSLVRNWRDGVRLALTAFGMCAVTLGTLYSATRGQFWFWIFANLTSHPIEAAGVQDGLMVALHFAPFAPLLPLVFVGLAWRRQASAATWLWFGMLLASVPASLLPYAKHGGWTNDMIPVIALIAPVTVLMLADLTRRQTRWADATRMAGIAGAIVFLCLRPVHVSAFVPDQRAWAAAQGLNSLVARLDGGLLVPQLAFTPARNGQTNPHWHRMGHADLVWSHHDVDEDWAVIRSQARYALLNQLDRGDFGMAIRRHFRLVTPLPDDIRVRMMTGGGVVDLDQLWERLPQAGSAP